MDERMWTIWEFAEKYKISLTRAHKIFRNEPGVIRLMAPGDKRPAIALPDSVVERVVRRMTVPERR
jgi:hypothetical protein